MRGVRVLEGREFVLAGRGSREQMERERESLRKKWRYVRLLPYGRGGFGRQIDDYSVWVNGYVPPEPPPTRHEPLDCAASPCDTCPYRKDTPRGVWDPSEYAKLPKYDPGQITTGIFLCHRSTALKRQTICRGWLTVAANSVAVRVGMMRGYITPEQRDQAVHVPLFASGAEAEAAGLSEVDAPSPEACAAIGRLERKGIGKHG